MLIEPKIIYLVVVPGDSIGDASLMQGFAQSLLANSHVIQHIANLPADVFELSDVGRTVLVQRRMSGAAPVSWYGQSPRTTRFEPHPVQVPFCLVLLPPEESPTDYREWAESSPTRPTIVSTSGGDLTYDDLTVDGLQRHFLKVCESISPEVDQSSVERARVALMQWKLPPKRHLGYQVGGHNTIAPNVSALSIAGFDDIVHGRFAAQRPGIIKPYVDQIVRTTESILNERARMGERDLHRIYRLTPDLNLFAPNIYPHVFSIAPPGDLSREEANRLRATIAILRSQSGYGFDLTETQASTIFGRDFIESRGKVEPLGNPLLSHRTQENFLSTAVMSVVAASEFSAVVRFPNDVNRVSGVVRSFAEHYRSRDRTPRKRLESFRKVQARLREAVPDELISLIRRSETGIRIVADAHIEWLDIDGLPLVLRKDCSRVSVTPGNLFIAQLSAKPLLHLEPSSFADVLVLSALKRDDPIARAFEIAFGEFEKHWRDRLRIKVVDIATKADFVAALNQFDGNIVVFDGHGSHEKDDAGKLHLQKESMDVWSLRDEALRMPPIVILSACDTHAADRNHATTANGFMLLGATTVLSSVFPLNALSAATFVARLLYRVAEYIPAAIRMREQALTWSEVVSGMIRMQLLTDFLLQLLRKKQITEQEYREAHMVGNMAINSFQSLPFDAVFSKLEELGLHAKQLGHELDLAISQSSAISYLQIGRPETIIIDDRDRVQKQLLALSERGTGNAVTEQPH